MIASSSDSLSVRMFSTLEARFNFPIVVNAFCNAERDGGACGELPISAKKV